MNRPVTDRQLELRSDYQDVRCAGCNGGSRCWLAKRRREKRKLHRCLRQEGKASIASSLNQ